MPASTKNRVVRDLRPSRPLILAAAKHRYRLIAKWWKPVIYPCPVSGGDRKSDSFQRDTLVPLSKVEDRNIQLSRYWGGGLNARISTGVGLADALGQPVAILGVDNPGEMRPPI